MTDTLYTVRREVVEEVEVLAPNETEALAAAVACAPGLWTATIQTEYVVTPKPRHTVGGKTSDTGWDYGTVHDRDCPACVASGQDFTLTPRSETFWAS